MATRWQFRTDDHRPLHAQRPSGAELAGFGLVRLAPLDLTHRYVDTADLSLARAVPALRLRSDGLHCQATLKALPTGPAGPQQRRKFTQPMSDGRIELLLAERAE